MALRQLMISKKLTEKREALQQNIARAGELVKREAEIEAALNEAKTEEETKVVEEEIEKFDLDKKANQEEKETLEKEIGELEKELEGERKKVTEPETREKGKDKGVKRDMPKGKMINRGAFAGMTIEQRDAFVAVTEVKDFLERTRQFIAQARTVSNVELLIPDVVLELLRDNIDKYSKVISHVKVKPVSGKARQRIAGTIPEAVWTEMVASLNELKISFNDAEVDGYKVGGFIAIENSYLEDSDINLAEEIISNLGQAIGYALDKAILYGKGTKMPLGIVTRLAQTSAPADYSKTARTWEDLHSTHILKLDLAAKKGSDFFAILLESLGVAKENYSNGNKVWFMNDTTKTSIISKTIAFNAAAALTANASDTMPIVGGTVVTLPFMQDGDIVGGYGSLYLLAERKGAQFATSDQVKFIEDMTVFKGTARYDGMPVIPEAFVAVNIKNAEVTTDMSFAEDVANKTETTGS